MRTPLTRASVLRRMVACGLGSTLLAGPCGAALDLSPRNLIGAELPRLEPPPLSRDALRARLMLGMRHMSGWPGDFEAMKPPKALALALEPIRGRLESGYVTEIQIGHWGGTWEKRLPNAPSSCADPAMRRARVSW